MEEEEPSLEQKSGELSKSNSEEGMSASELSDETPPKSLVPPASALEADSVPMLMDETDQADGAPCGYAGSPLSPSSPTPPSPSADTQEADAEDGLLPHSEEEEEYDHDDQLKEGSTARGSEDQAGTAGPPGGAGPEARPSSG